jgi:hypothetical protein
LIGAPEEGFDLSAVLSNDLAQNEVVQEARPLPKSTIVVPLEVVSGPMPAFGDGQVYHTEICGKHCGTRDWSQIMGLERAAGVGCQSS